MMHYCTAAVVALVASLTMYSTVSRAERQASLRVLATRPAHVQLERVERIEHISRGFAQLEDGTYGITLLVEYLDSFDRRFREFLHFRLAEGQIVQEGDSLLLAHPTLAGDKILVGFGKWWYAPRWQAAGRGTIEVKTERHLRTVTLSAWLAIH
jgi:hypothetical protein